MSSAHPPDSRRSHTTDSAPQTKTAHTPTYERDPTYYYPDGNIVFLADGVLFRVYAFLVLPVDSITSTAENTGQRYPLGVDDLPERLTDSSDIYPIALPHVTATQFRSYLLALLGRIYDPEYRSLFTDTKAKEKHSQDLLVHLLDIADVSRQFGTDKLQEWAVSQLELVLESMYELATNGWDKDTLLRLHSCARRSGRSRFVSLTTNFIQYFLSIWTVPEGEDAAQEHSPSNLDTCVQLFGDPNLPNNDPALFGCAFASILALGYRSTAWTSGVTRRQRAVLYAAQVQLTTSNEESATLRAGQPKSWASLLRPCGQAFSVCEECQREFKYTWDLSFGKYRELKSAGSLQGLTARARLPQYRRLFAARFAPHKPGAMPELLDHSIGFFTGQAKDHIFYSEPTSRMDGLAKVRETCTGTEWPFRYLDNQIQLVYQDLAERYKHIALYVGLTHSTSSEELTYIYRNTGRFELQLGPCSA